MTVLRHASIGRRVAVAVLIPLLAALGFGGDIIWRGWEDASGARLMAGIAAPGPQFGAVVHQLQVERGLTGTVLRDTANREAAVARDGQVAKVDAALSALREAVAAAPPATGRSAAVVRTAFDRIEDLRPLRDAVAARTVAPDQAMERYSAMIEALLGPIEALAGNGQVGTTARAIVAYTSILRAKEAAGLERAAGAGAFSPVGFARDRYRLFAELAAVQDSYLAVAGRFGSRGQADALAALDRSGEADAVRSLRRLAAAAALGEGRGVDPLVWFRAATARIDAIRTLEDRFAGQLMEAVAAVAREAETRLAAAALIVLAVTAVAVAAAAVAVRSITGPLRVLTGQLQALAAGRYDIAVEGLDRRDEVGEIARLAEVLKESGREAERLRGERAAAEARSADEKRAMLDALAAEFEMAVGAIVQRVSTSADQLKAAASSLSGAATACGAQANAVAAASEQSSSNIQTVASATEELAGSVQEIAAQVTRSADMSAKAVTAADQSAARIEDLATHAGDQRCRRPHPRRRLAD